MTLVEVLVVAVVVLLALLVGAALPALVQLRRTLRTADRFMETTGRRLERTLDEAGEASGRFNRILEDLEGGLGQVRGLFHAAAELTQSMTRLREAVRLASTVATAVGPAVAAAIQALIRPTEAAGTEPQPPPDAGASPEVSASGVGSTPDSHPSEVRRETEVSLP